jgi:hypothetical protein
MNKLFLAGMFLLVGLSFCVAVGVVVLTVRSDAQKKVSVATARSNYQVVSTRDLKNADPDIVRLQKIYPYLSIDWGIAPSNLSWSTLTIELPDDTDAANALAMAFAYRTCDITTRLAPQVKSMAELWLRSDRRRDIEQVHGDWGLSVGGYAEDELFRFRLSIGWPEHVDANIEASKSKTVLP